MIEQISVHSLAEKLKSAAPVYLIDVRQPWESDLAALAGSVRIPLNELPERINELAPPNGAMVVAYCHHGVRSLTAAGILIRHGFEQVHSLAGGIDAWSREIDASIPRY
jgi:adenylyltransferase/sulfurtransferase